MLEVLDSKADVIALKFEGHLTREDVSRAYDLLEPALATNEKTHLYIEVHRLGGLDTEAVLQELPRGLRLLGRLARFGRIAIIADQDWIRRAAIVESALLPGISYRTYRLDERDQALAWVEGRQKLPYNHALRLIETDRPKVIGIEIDGRLSAEEMADASRELNRLRKERGIDCVLLRIKNFAGFDPGMALDRNYLQMKFGFLRDLKKYAVVGGPDWVEQWTEFVAPFIRIEARHFDSDEEADAWRWLEARPVGEEKRFD